MSSEKSTTRKRKKQPELTISQRVQAIRLACEIVERGGTFTAATDQIKAKLKIDVLWSSLVRWAKTHETREAVECRQAIEDAKQFRVEYWADQVVQLTDNCPLDRDAVAKVREQVKVRLWMLEKLAPHKYGPNPTGDLDPGVPTKVLVIREQDPAKRVPSKTGRKPVDSSVAAPAASDAGSSQPKQAKASRRKVRAAPEGALPGHELAGALAASSPRRGQPAQVLNGNGHLNGHSSNGTSKNANGKKKPDH